MQKALVALGLLFLWTVLMAALTWWVVQVYEEDSRRQASSLRGTPRRR